MDRAGSLSGWSLNEAEDPAGLLVDPVLSVVDAAVRLRGDVLAMRFGGVTRGYSAVDLVDVQIEGHGGLPVGIDRSAVYLGSSTALVAPNRWPPGGCGTVGESQEAHPDRAEGPERGRSRVTRPAPADPRAARLVRRLGLRDLRRQAGAGVARALRPGDHAPALRAAYDGRAGEGGGRARRGHAGGARAGRGEGRGGRAAARRQRRLSRQSPPVGPASRAGPRRGPKRDAGPRRVHAGRPGRRRSVRTPSPP